MKITVKHAETKKQTYPYFAAHKRDGHIVLISSDNNGVTHTAITTCGPGYSFQVAECEWERITGEITITQ